jgi:serine/threonine protein kinase
MAKMTEVEQRDGVGKVTRVESAFSDSDSKKRASIEPARLFPNGFMGYTVEAHIGGGGEAQVFRVRNGSEVRALKVFNYAPSKQDKIDLILRLSRDHPDCFVRIFESDYHPDLHGTGFEWYELQEYVENGSLNDLLESFHGDAAQEYFTKERTRDFISQIAAALEVLVKNDIVHQDMTPGNILIREKSPLKIAISDFGIATVLTGDAHSRFTVNKGTRLYRSPEQFLSRASRNTDFWALGVIIYELLMNRNPFKALESDEEVFRVISKGLRLPDLSDRVDESFILLLKGLLTGYKNHEQRWGCKELKRWLDGERDIPEFFSGSFDTEKSSRFPIDGIDYDNLQDVIRYYANGPDQWKAGTKALRGDPSTIWTWLVQNGQLKEADQVNQIRNMRTQNNNEAFFNFIYTFNTDLDFRYMGRAITLNTLAESVQRENNNRHDEGSREIYKAISDGTMSRLCADFLRLTGRTDVFTLRIEELCNVLAGENARQMLDAFIAIKRWQETHSIKRIVFWSVFTLIAAVLLGTVCWFSQAYFLRTEDTPSFVYNILTWGKLKTLGGGEISSFRSAHLISVTLFVLSTFFIQRDRLKDWGNVSGGNFTPELPGNLRQLTWRANKNSTFYKIMQGSACMFLLIPFLTGMYLTTDEKIASYAADGNAKAEAFLKKTVRSTKPDNSRQAVQTPVTVVQFPFDAQIKKNRTDVNIRSQETSKSQSHGKVNGGFPLRVIGESSGQSVGNSKLWYKVEYQTSSGRKNTGYIHSSFVERRGSAAAASSQTKNEAPSSSGPQKNTQAAVRNVPKTNDTANDAKYQNLINEAKQLQNAGRLDEAHKKYSEAQLTRDSRELRNTMISLEKQINEENKQKQQAASFEKEGDNALSRGKYIEAKGKYRNSLITFYDPRVQGKLDSVESVERASKLSSEGDVLMKQSKYKAAIEKYQESLELVNDPDVALKYSEAARKREEQRKIEQAGMQIIQGVLEGLTK